MSALDRFLHYYQTIRRVEGWGATDPTYYQNLPHVAADDPQHSIWQVRAANFGAFLQIIGANRRVLDLGAGNGWLAFQLSRRGHSVVAVDINDDEFDGLGARRNYPLILNACRADFAALPLKINFDCIVFNASLHYARAIPPVIAEALRLLAPDGMLVVMDSPLYHDAASGRAMFADKRRGFQAQLGLEISNDVIGFLTFAEFENLSRTCAIDWRWIEPRVNVRWATRHLWAHLRGRREPARFGLMVGRKKIRR